MVALTFRTAGPWGVGKGANLEPSEVDENFNALDEAVEGLIADPPTAIGIGDITVEGNLLTITLTDATVFGPFELPPAPPAPVGTIATATLTVGAEHLGFYLRCTHVDGCAIELPADLAVGAEVHFRQTAGNLAFVAGAGALISEKAGFADATERVGATVTAKHAGEGLWDLFGLLALAEPTSEPTSG